MIIIFIIILLMIVYVIVTGGNFNYFSDKKTLQNMIDIEVARDLELYEKGYHYCHKRTKWISSDKKTTITIKRIKK